jgi:hypothetical protein
MGRVSRDARLTFILMWPQADDSGRLRGSSRMLASVLYPFDDDAPKKIEGWLGELVKAGTIVRYTSGENAYIQICNWLSHQKIDHPTPSKIPAPSESSLILASPRESSPLDQGLEGIKEGKGKEGNTTAASRPTLDAMKAVYPKRAGAQPWGRAEKAIAARLREGVSEIEILDGASRYAAFAKETGIDGTAYVMQVATFCGPEKHFLEPWAPPPTSGEKRQIANVQAGQDWLEGKHAPF